MKLASLCSRALVNASIKGYLDIVLLLLNFGVNPNKIDIITGTGAQHEAVRFSSLKDDKMRDIRLKIIQYLSMYGADPNLPNTSGETPIRLASQKPPNIIESYMNALRSGY
jgi:ankyrin repeat protein